MCTNNAERDTLVNLPAKQKMVRPNANNMITGLLFHKQISTENIEIAPPTTIQLHSQLNEFLPSFGMTSTIWPPPFLLE